MKRFPFIFSILIISAGLLLQACSGSGSNNNGSPWQYSSKPRQAIDKPAVLDDPASAPIDTSPQNQQSATITPRQDLAPVKVGIILPLTGKNADLGQSMLNAAQMALFEIGHNSFELVPRDTGGTAEGARAAAQDSINNGAQLILGPIFAEEVRAAKPVTRNAGVNMIAFSTDWTLGDNSTYLMGFMPFDQVNRILNYTAGQGLKNVGVFAPSNSYGDAVVSAFNNTAHRAGLNTLQVKRFAANGSDIPAQMQAFSQNSSGAYDAILMPMGGSLAASASRSAAQYSMPPNIVKRIGTGLWEDSVLAQEPSLQGSWFAGPSPNMRQSFEGRYRQTFGGNPPRLATLAYDATALAAVLAKNGLQQGAQPSFDSVSIQNSNGFAGIDGIFRFREGGLAERGLAVLEFDRGQMRVIEEAPRTFQQVTN